MKRKLISFFLTAVMILGCAAAASAELVSRGDGMWYDRDYNVTWYAYPLMANLYWQEAAAWAAALNVKGITGWRLPSAYNRDGSGPCTGMYCRMSEYGHLYYTELGNPGYPVEPNFGPFEATAQKFYYWTGTTSPADPSRAYIFQMHSGDSILARKTVDTAFAWAVHDGDPAAPPPPPPVVPEPDPVITPAVVDIDISQGAINPKSRGKIPVVILSATDFDAPGMVDQKTLTFGRLGLEKSLAFCDVYAKDVNGDGLKDLVCHFYTQDTGIQCGTLEAFLKGNTTEGLPFEGRDSIRIVPSCR
jgi:hypothetical protein